MPIFKKGGSKCPRHIGQCQAGLDAQVLRDVFGIIVIDEIEPPYRPIGRKGQSQEGQDDEEITFFAGCPRMGCRHSRSYFCTRRHH